MTHSIYFPTNGDHISSVANNLFDQVFKKDWRRLLPGRFRKEQQPLQILPEETMSEVAVAESQTQRVDLQQVNGSISSTRGEDFDTAFRPVSQHLKERWVSVAKACLQQKVLPPVQLVQIDESFFVVDGHHRVSVAKSLGHDEILASVTRYKLS